MKKQSPPSITLIFSGSSSMIRHWGVARSVTSEIGDLTEHEALVMAADLRLKFGTVALIY